MKKRLFIDPEIIPTDSLLQEQLGSAMKYYIDVVTTSRDYRRQWQYSRGNGWILKVDDMRKALYYLIAFEEGIEISLTVRDAERTAFLNNKKCENIYPRLEAGTKYAEGYALRFEVENVHECSSVVAFISELMKVRPVTKTLTDKQKKRHNANESRSTKTAKQLSGKGNRQIGTTKKGAHNKSLELSP
jgi:hypothetical protein